VVGRVPNNQSSRWDRNTSWLDHGTEIEILQPTENSLKFTIPAGLQRGIFAYQVRLENGESLGGLINRAEVWWAQGAPGVSLLAGHSVRVFGRNLSWAATGAGSCGTFIGIRGATKAVMVASSSDEYSAIATLPANIPPGKYGLYVHNGVGGSEYWSNPISVEVIRPRRAPATIIHVKQFGADG
jgi:hypothetical protein